MSEAYRDYRLRYRELSILLKLGHELEVRIPRNPELETSLARGVVVLVAGHLEAFLEHLAAETAGQYPTDPYAMSRTQSRLAACYIRDELIKTGDSFKEHDFYESKQVLSLYEAVARTAALLSNPTKIPKDRKYLQGFYRELAPDAVNRLLQRLHPTNQSFFSWLAQRGVDISGVKTLLTQLVETRTEIAHGDLNSQPSLVDARNYSLMAALVARMADRFVRK